MIRTKLDTEAAHKILELGRLLVAESHFKDHPYETDRCKLILAATIKDPDKFFIAFDDQFRGFILMGMQQRFFSDYKWAADYGLFILPEHRNGLLAPRLIEAAEHWAKENGAFEMTIFHNTGINSEKATTFFNRRGYKTAGYIFTKEL